MIAKTSIIEPSPIGASSATRARASTSGAVRPSRAAPCLHPVTYMPTKIVLSARGSALSTLEEGVRTTMRLISASELDEISGRYFNGLNEARADEQAYDADARLRLRELSEHLVGLSSRRA